MGTDMEHRPAADNDDALPWRIEGPDADGDVWLEWTGAGRHERFNLGPKDAVQAALSDWLVGLGLDQES
jgi:hypothetical protein